MARTVIQAFTEFSSNLEITGLQGNTVSARQTNVRNKLGSRMTVLDSFLTGSYQRNTMIAPLGDADIDIFVELDPKYYLPYEVDTQAKLIEKVKRAVQNEYSDATEVSRNGQAVTIKFHDFKVDLVPGFLWQDKRGFHIPDSVGKLWIQTNPKSHVTIWADRNLKQNGRLVPLIKMIKAWNRAHSEKFRSFHLETLILDIFSSQVVNNYWEAAHHFFKTAQNMFTATKDPAGIGGSLTMYLKSVQRQQDALTCLQAAEGQALRACIAGANSNPGEAIRLWKIVFGDYFPTYG